MNNLIEKHETAIRILEVIKSAERQINLYQGSLDGFPGTFAELKRKYKHKIQILNMSIERLKQRHQNIINQLNSKS